MLSLARIIRDSSAAIADTPLQQAWQQASRGQRAGVPLVTSIYCRGWLRRLRRCLSRFGGVSWRFRDELSGIMQASFVE